MVLQQFLPGRSRQNAKEQAVVINFNSIAAYNVLLPNLVSSHVVSKAAMWRMMETISMDILDETVLPGGARLISIHPGNVKTGMYRKAGLEGVAQVKSTGPGLAGDFVV
ncbi:hypothetical protein G647_08996 [Cladophialophora carrionii CBS 160.54]|uniref:Uncharacterized protein n=1 Tax=Cladophialophora carrionii CBS 160.54 TaxID=1279043 RepID=V9D013_9EURO|nr:uncharacterized protein G647_08996 [Cladophialophora carrionii CBS 160.54]ETI19981.1 hypothetical protein G647_08996 [Cladophialophora carrionii CBS 160.54]